MSKNEQDAFRIVWQRKKFPADAELLARLNQALGFVERAGPIVNAYVDNKADSLAGSTRVS